MFGQMAFQCLTLAGQCPAMRANQSPLIKYRDSRRLHLHLHTLPNQLPRHRVQRAVNLNVCVAMDLGPLVGHDVVGRLRQGQERFTLVRFKRLHRLASRNTVRKRSGGEPTSRDRSLGTDPKSRQFRQAEADAARRLEARVGPLKRDPSGAGEWIDEAGRVYDAVGPVPNAHFRLDQVTRSIDRHLLKQGVDIVVVDVTGLSTSNAARIKSFVNGLDAGSRARIIVQGG